jgi:carboxypeptidase Taq
MGTFTARTAFLELWGEVEDLSRAAQALEWDQETQMPAKGQPARGKVLATLAGLRHAKLTAPELADRLAAFEAQAEADGDDAAMAAAARRDVERASRVPTALAKRQAEAASNGLVAWQRARKAADFKLFERELAELIAIAKEIGACLAPLTASGKPYDALLDEFEPGATEALLTPLFDSLRASLSPIVKAVADSGVVVDESVAKGDFPEAAQLAFARRIATQMGFDFDAGRIDLAAHPFCTGFDPGDVRLTWRYSASDFRPALYGIMHEAGHGLYEQGLPPEWSRTPLGHAVSLGVHESQSRLWENLVGRSRGFWEWALPVFREHFPGASGTRAISVDSIYPALHTVRPSLIRVEADEATYNLHVVARYEVERALFGGGLSVTDLPDAWDDAYESLLGIRAPGVADGVLQDIHWSMGAFGYFPTYALGNLINAQLFEAAQDDLGELSGAFARGELAPLLGWLRERIHRPARRYTATELVERATGKPLAADAFLAHVRRTTADVYGVRC